jgi:hypothetical protein
MYPNGWYYVPMSVIWRAVCHCDMCGHEWIREGETMPDRCPKRTCRSRQWNKESSPPLPAAEVIAKMPIHLQPKLQPASSLPTPAPEDKCPHGFNTVAFCRVYNRGSKCPL